MDLADDQIEADHVKPVARGGMYVYDNLVTACRPCNRLKRDETEGWSPNPIAWTLRQRGPRWWARLKERRREWLLHDIYNRESQEHARRVAHQHKLKTDPRYRGRHFGRGRW